MATLTTSWQMLAETYLGTSSGNLYVRLYAYYSQQDIANNKSYVIFQARAYYTGGYIRDNQGSGHVGGISGYVDGSCTYMAKGETIIATTEGWVSHADDGTLGVHGEAYLHLPNWGWSGTADAWATLPSIPRQAKISTAPNFTDEDNPTITYSNPAGNAISGISACIAWPDGGIIIPYRSISKTGSSYTFNFTNEERTKLYNAVLSGGNTATVKFVIYSEISGNSYWSGLERTLTIINAAPTLSPTVEDLGSVSTGVTGNPNLLLRYFNYPKATFNAVAKKGASIISRTVTCGNVTKTADDGDWVQFDNVSDNIFTFTIRDNRGNTVSKSIAKDMINYVIPTCRTVITTDLSPDNTASINLNISGNYYEGSLGKTDNSLAVEYRYRNNSGDFPKDDSGNDVWLQSVATVTENGYISNATLENVSYTDIYIIQTRIRDAVYTSGVYAKEEIVRVLPTFDWGENDFNFNVPVFREGNPMGYYPIGGIYTSSDNTNPGELFGGTWELERRFYGGELLAYGTAWNSKDPGVTCTKDVNYGFSDIMSGVYSSHLCNHMPDILTDSYGTIYVQTKGVVGLIEATMTISGLIGSYGCYGIWFKDTNKNTLPSNVTLTGGGVLVSANGYYSGNSNTYFYNISDADTGTGFFVNPNWSAYGGNIEPCDSGTRSTLQVKAYAKGKVTYMWRRVA